MAKKSDMKQCQLCTRMTASKKGLCFVCNKEVTKEYLSLR